MSKQNFRHWFRHFLKAFTQDTLELSDLVPVNETCALELAKEHYAFCPDRVYQGTES
ncbi:MAG: DUF4253 domain-containing protein [Clostridiaceae bacterium]|nr:DUF4253 domain-containing protein [Clostridiaceae bacterium]